MQQKQKWNVNDRPIFFSTWGDTNKY
jgi:hypothetical protein